MTGGPDVPSSRARPARTPEQRQAELDATFDRLQAGVESLRSSDGWRAWLDFAARMPSYSVNNQVLIVMQRSDATAVASYSTWKSLGRQVRRGEAGIRILAPTTRTSPGDVAADSDAGSGEGSNAAGSDQLRDVRGQRARVVTGFRAVAVFDVSQTDGDPLPTPERPTLLTGQAPDELWEGLEHQVTAAGFALGRVPDAGAIGGANGMTDFATRTVLVRADVTDAQAAKTLAHELAHVLLHDPRADPTWAMPCREVKEVEAESVAYLVTAHAGLDSSDYTFGYVAGWAADRPADALTAAATRIMDAARTITEGLDDASAHGSPGPVPSIGLRHTGPEIGPRAGRGRPASLAGPRSLALTP